MSVIRFSVIGTFVAIQAMAIGCHHHPKITAHRIPNPGECVSSCCGDDEHGGIPFYLPKPLLVVAKNFRYIEEGKVGLYDSPPIPNGYDNQAAYATLNASAAMNMTGGSGTTQAVALNPTPATGTTAVSSTPKVYNGAAPHTMPTAPTDGLKPDAFYTYQIIFVPDMTQKYALKFKGGNGEMRAAMQLVNGWQFTGLGPFYLKDSSSAQNMMAFGIGSSLTSRGVADAVSTLVNLKAGAGGGTKENSISEDQLNKINNAFRNAQVEYTNIVPQKILNYAEIRIYEPSVIGGQMEWKEIVNQSFDRDYIASYKSTVPAVVQLPAPSNPAPGTTGRTEGAITGPVTPAGLDPNNLRQILAASGLPTVAPILPSGGKTESAIGGTATPGVVNQNVNVNCDDDKNCGRPWYHPNQWFGGRAVKARPVHKQTVIDGDLDAMLMQTPPPTQAPAVNPGTNRTQTVPPQN